MIMLPLHKLTYGLLKKKSAGRKNYQFIFSGNYVFAKQFKLHGQIYVLVKLYFSKPVFEPTNFFIFN